MMTEVCGGTSRMMMEVWWYQSYDDGGASRTITVCGATESILINSNS